jgi:hypothetical protein
MADYNLGFGGPNPYTNGAVNATMGDMARNYNLINRPQQETSMINSGSFGNSGLQQMQQNADLNQQKAMGDTASQMRNNQFLGQQSFDANQYWTGQNFDANRYDTTFNQNQQNLQTGLGLLSAQNGYNQNDINNSTNIQNAPMNYFNQFSNMANSAGGMGGSNTQNMTGNPLLGALGGWSLGNSFAKA